MRGQALACMDLLRRSLMRGQALACMDLLWWGMEDREVCSGLEIAPVLGAFATKYFTFATKIYLLVAILQLFYGLANKGIIFNSLVSYL